MFEGKRLSRIFAEAEQIPFDDSSKIILFSDCHRGDGSWADDFFKDRNVYYTALTHYFNRNFTYIELGDGDELWKNKKFSVIIREYGDVFQIISGFIKEDRFYSIYGNHDYVKKHLNALMDNGFRGLDERLMKFLRIFMGVKHHEGLILRHRITDCTLFLLHGHQADFWNDQLKRVSRFLVRYLWKPLEILGLNDPTSPAGNYGKLAKVEKKLLNWIRKERQPLVAGHTHRPVFPIEGELPYFNDGSCVHPDGITGIEIMEGNIILVKWSVKAKNDGTLFVGKEILAGPSKLAEYFSIM